MMRGTEPPAAPVVLGEARLQAGGDCRVCGTPIRCAAVYCVRCHTPHHEECAVWVGSCSTFGCGERRFARQLPEATAGGLAPQSVLDLVGAARSARAAGAQDLMVPLPAALSPAAAPAAPHARSRPWELFLPVSSGWDQAAVPLLRAGALVTGAAFAVLSPVVLTGALPSAVGVSEGFAAAGIALFLIAGLIAALVPRDRGYFLDGASRRLTYHCRVLGLELSWRIAALEEVRAVGVDRRQELGGIRERVYLELARGRRIPVSPDIQSDTACGAPASADGLKLLKLWCEISRLLDIRAAGPRHP